MTDLLIDDKSGGPKRCFTLGSGTPEQRTICISWFQYSELWWRWLSPDPPNAILEIEGVTPELLRDLAIMDTINWLSRKLDSKLAKPFEGAVSASVKAIQAEFPPGVSLTSLEKK